MSDAYFLPCVDHLDGEKMLRDHGFGISNESEKTLAEYTE